MNKLAKIKSQIDFFLLKGSIKKPRKYSDNEADTKVGKLIKEMYKKELSHLNSR